MAGVAAALAAHFAPGDLAAAQNLVERYGTQPGENERERVQLAMIMLSGGQLEALARWLRDAQRDYRDVLGAQQTGPLTPAQGEALAGQARALLKRWGRPG